MDGEPKIGILFETVQEFQIVKPHLGRLAEWGVPYAVTMVSALRSPERLKQWLAQREREGIEVFIVAVGGAASLAGAVAASTDRPVLAVPLDTTHLRGQDALYAIAGLADGIPVAAVGINKVENAIHCAIRLLALRHPEYEALLKRLRSEWGERESLAVENLKERYPEIFSPPSTPAAKEEPAPREPAEPPPEPVPPETPASAPRAPSAGGEAPRKPAPAPKRPSGRRIEVTPREVERPAEKKTPPPAGTPAKRRGARRIVVDPRQPDVEAIEEVADTLLEGGIVALPTDTVYGLAALSTNREAVRRLYRIKGRERNKPIPLLIHSTRGLAHLVSEVPEAVRPLLESHWPGALTLVFRKYPGAFIEVSSGETIGIRMPDHMVALAVLSMVARPLAVTSANLAGRPPALTAEEVLDSFADTIECVLDAGRAPGTTVSTVLSVAESPFRILREGAISYDALKTILGDELAELE